MYRIILLNCANHIRSTRMLCFVLLSMQTLHYPQMPCADPATERLLNGADPAPKTACKPCKNVTIDLKIVLEYMQTLRSIPNSNFFSNLICRPCRLIEKSN